MNEPRVDHLPISDTPRGDQVRGEWYVRRMVPCSEFFDGGKDRAQYLHADGEWRWSTYSGENWGDPTGYFATEDDAKAALAKARGETT